MAQTLNVLFAHILDIHKKRNIYTLTSTAILSTIESIAKRHAPDEKGEEEEIWSTQ